MRVAEVDYEGGLEGGGDFGEGADGEVLVAGLYAGDYGLGGAYGFGELALGHFGFGAGFGYLQGQAHLYVGLGI